MGLALFASHENAGKLDCGVPTPFAFTAVPADHSKKSKSVDNLTAEPVTTRITAVVNDHSQEMMTHANSGT